LIGANQELNRTEVDQAGSRKRDPAFVSRSSILILL